MMGNRAFRSCGRRVVSISSGSARLCTGGQISVETRLSELDQQVTTYSGALGAIQSKRLRERQVGEQ
jgi:hypothetical protein